MDNFDGQSGIKDFIEERIFEEEKIKDGLAKIKDLTLE
jgi:hypothetical protein